MWLIGANRVPDLPPVLCHMTPGTAHRVQTKNTQGLMRALQQRPQGQPLLTVSNHASCLDDPVIWSEWMGNMSSSMN